MSPIGSRHAGIVDRLNMLLARRLGRHVIVRVQNPIVLDDYSERSRISRSSGPGRLLRRRPPSPGRRAADDRGHGHERLVRSHAQAPALRAKTRARALAGRSSAAAVDVYRRPTTSGYREHQHLPQWPPDRSGRVSAVHFRVAEILGEWGFGVPEADAR